MVIAAARRSVRRFLEARGYYVSLRRVLPYGVDYMLDIQRLSDVWNYPIRTFFDVGANIGQTTSAALKAFPCAKVVAFEPHPDTFSRLSQNIGAEPRFVPFNIALGEHCGPVRLFETEDSLATSLVPNSVGAVVYKPTSRQLTIQCATVDVFCQEHELSSIDVLKIDTEGCDLMVLRGSEKMLSARRIRFVFTEFNAVENDDPDVQMTAFIPLHRYLAAFGFRFVATYTDFFSPTSH